METPRAKKSFGQHFLRDQQAVQRICKALQWQGQQYQPVLEVGPGPGAITGCLLERFGEDLHLVELDRDMVAHLQEHFPQIGERLHQEDFLRLDFRQLFSTEPIAIVGNFPYNISTQIVFKVLEHREQIPEVVGMFQREVAQRIAATPGGKERGIQSVLVQAFYEVDYLFTLPESAFSPPPKVKSAVLHLQRKEQHQLEVDEALLFQVVKMAFNQRRKTLRNALKTYHEALADAPGELLQKRAEVLTLEEFIALTQIIEHNR